MIYVYSSEREKKDFNSCSAPSFMQVCYVANANQCIPRLQNNKSVKQTSECPRSHRLVFPPSVAAGHALVEARHGLVGASNLDLVKCGLEAVAIFGRALNAGLLRIVPRAGPAKHVFLFLALVVAPREDGLSDGVLKRTGAAFEAIGTLIGAGDGENVGAVRANCANVRLGACRMGEGGFSRQEEGGCFRTEKHRGEGCDGVAGSRCDVM